MNGLFRNRKGIMAAVLAGMLVFGAAGAVFADDWDEAGYDDYEYDDYEYDDYEYDEEDWETYGGEEEWEEDDEDIEDSPGFPEGFTFHPSEEPASVGGRDIDAIKAELSAMGGTLDELAEAGAVTVGDDISNFDVWVSFVTAVREKTPAKVTVASRTKQGDVAVDRIDYNGSDFVCVHDSTRDHHYLGSSYIVRTYRYLTGFGSGGRILLGPDGNDGTADDTRENWLSAALTTVPYTSMDGIEEAVEEDDEGETVPTVLFKRASGAENSEENDGGEEIRMEDVYTYTEEYED